MKTRHLLGLAAVALPGMMLIAGCEGSDDLRMHNNYPFSVRVRLSLQDGVTHKPVRQVIGIVPAHGVATFQAAASYRGGALGNIQYETIEGKALGSLSKTKPGTTRAGTGSVAGGAIWDVTVP